MAVTNHHLKVLRSIFTEILTEYPKYYVGTILYMPISETKFLQLGVKENTHNYLDRLVVRVYHKDNGLIFEQHINFNTYPTQFRYDLLTNNFNRPPTKADLLKIVNDVDTICRLFK